MSRSLLPDDLWEFIQSFLPPPKHRRFRHPGRKRIDNRKCLTGIIFVLKTGLPWEYLPQEMGCGSPMTCWRRLRDWQKAGVFEKIHRALLDRLNREGLIDWKHGIIDSASLRAVGAGGKNRAQSHRSAQARKQTPPAYRGERGPSGPSAHRSSSARRHPTPPSR
jgi:transposase